MDSSRRPTTLLLHNGIGGNTKSVLVNNTKSLLVNSTLPVSSMECGRKEDILESNGIKSGCSDTEEYMENKESGLYWILLQIRIQGMRRKSLKSKWELFYLFYQFLIILFFLFFAGEIFYSYEVSHIKFGPELLTKLLNFMSYLQAAFTTGNYINR